MFSIVDDDVVVATKSLGSTNYFMSMMCHFDESMATGARWMHAAAALDFVDRMERNASPSVRRREDIV